MTLDLVVNGKRIIINDDVIERDIRTLEEQGMVARVERGVSVGPRPDVHGLLTCLRDKRLCIYNQNPQYGLFQNRI